MKRFYAYFGFTKAERRGFSVLVLLAFVIGVIPVIYRFFNDEQQLVHSVTYFSHTDREEDVQYHEPKYTGGEDQKKRVEKISYFHFDPNGLSEVDWQKLGFSSKQIAVIKNYEAKGGRFHKKEDVAKIYSISKEDYERIESYIVIEGNKYKGTIETAHTNTGNIYHKSEKIVEYPIDINEADTSAFKKLRGIGSVLSARMVKYRDALGGFQEISQVGEVYGIAPEVFEQIAPLLVVGEPHIKKLNVNHFTKEQLAKHPYISNKQAMLIVNYRSQHGAFTSLDDLRKIPVLDDVFFRNIAKYVSCNVINAFLTQ